MPAERASRRAPHSGAALPSLLEAAFPFAKVSAVARADRYSRDGVYAAHKWWARRPPSIIRALLLAAALPADTSDQDFWRRYSNGAPALEGLHVGDPFMGGATTLVEAARLGARVTGIDVDPLAVLIAREELADLGDPAAFAQAADALLAHMRGCCNELYGIQEGSPEPLHYFYLRSISCEDCGTESLMYRNPVLARDVGKNGGVVRGRGTDVFCPDCRTLRRLSESRRAFRCCGRLHRLDRGTYERAAHTCPGCGARRRHEHLRTGVRPRTLVAVEETVSRGRRRLRAPTTSDLTLIATTGKVAERFADRLPGAELKGVDAGRPFLYGFRTIADLFTDRQKVVFANAFSWVDRQADLPETIATRLRLAISNALASNNVLCGYATDYGRLAPMFAGVRSYAMPVLSVELNPLHRSAGRGTLAATMRRVQRSLVTETRRHAYDPDSDKISQRVFAARRASKHHVVCQSADRSFPGKLGPCDLIVTDPPYFDFIAYSDLSLLYRAWLWPDAKEGSLGGRPIYPLGDNPIDDFAGRLGRAFAKAASSLKPGGSMTFTFHSTNPDAWDALSKALIKAKLWVTAAFPVWADARAAAHAHPGNCEWDLVLTCRPAGTCQRPALTHTVEEWCHELGTDGPSGNDLTNLRLGLEAVRVANSKESRA